MVHIFRPAVPGLSRRELVKLGVAGAAALPISALGFPALAQSKPDQLVIASGGGKLDEAYKKAYWDTFTAKHGIKIVTTEYAGLAKIQSMIEANNVDIDVLNIDAAEAPVAGKKGWLVPIDWSLTDRAAVLPVAARDDHVYAEVAAKVLAWHKTTFPEGKAPTGWVDMWNMQAFPGKRSMWKQAFQTMDIAAMGDGVPKDKLYPLDADRALAALDKIRSNLIWWESGAQGAQLLMDGESDVGTAWSGRVYQPKVDGADIDYTLNDALFVAGSWAIVKGCKNEKWSQEYVAHTLIPENQAIYSETIAYGPVVPAALKLLPPERLAVLPSSEENFKKGIFQDFDFWAEKGDPIIKQFNDWLTKG
jgi:putative spermidine/putrescine transport system substrate-binding protein